MAMAYRAGVPLKDMEFIQYHPTGLPGTGILITEGSRGEGGILVNKDGYRYLQDYNLGPPDPWPRKKAMELGPRDRLSQAFWHEQQKGRTIKTPHGDVVHLDIRHLGEKKINERLPMVRELAQSYVGVDPVHEPIPVRPVVHYTMGGIHTDIDTATPLARPVRRRANAPACRSTAPTGSAPTRWPRSWSSAPAPDAARRRSPRPIRPARPAPPRKAPRPRRRASARCSCARAAARPSSGLRKAMNDTMESGAGIYRSRGLAAGDLPACSPSCARATTQVQLQDRSNVFNTDLIQVLELGSMLEVAEAMAHSALRRKESRGSHQRLDHPGAGRRQLPQAQPRHLPRRRAAGDRAIATW